MNRNAALLTSEIMHGRLDAAIRWAERELKHARAAERQLSTLISRLVKEDEPPQITTSLLGVSGVKRPTKIFALSSGGLHA
jgi:hypothetical protein